MAGAFGTEFGQHMAVARFEEGAWTESSMQPVGPIEFHPATHALHYGSSCFEGLKAHKGVDGVVRMFRPDRHAARLRASAETLHLPVPPADLITAMLEDTVRANLDLVPDAPGALYLRPVILGTEHNIGAAAAPSKTALFYVLPSPVGDYFAGGIRPLKLKVETTLPRTTPQFGQVKSGANYVMALGPTLEAKATLGVDQVLFTSDGIVSETGAANFLLIDAERIVTAALDSSFLHGVTRDSILNLGRDMGLEIEERDITLDELKAWAARPDAEAALSGTAAVLAGVGTLVFDGQEVVIGSGDVGPTTLRLREALVQLQLGKDEDTHDWTCAVKP